MGNILNRKPADDLDTSWLEQYQKMGLNPIYKFADLNRRGTLIEAYRKGGVVAVQEIARQEIGLCLYNTGEGAIIRKLDYIKWQRSKEAKKTGSTIWESKTDKELVEEWDKQEKATKSFKTVEDHEACWNLQQRGAMGETSLHLLFLMDSAEHTETARILLNMYPKLALDFYEADEYYGENGIHLAIVYGDYESVKLLVSNGAFINQRATGRFFLPEDQKNGRTKETNYEGFAYYGEYPLSFAACFGYMEIYDYLIDNGADPNLQDSFGNTALHMTVIYDQPEMYRYMVKHPKKPAKSDICNNANLSPLTLACKLGRHKLFKYILEINKMDFWRFSNLDCSAYPLTEIDSISADGRPNYDSALMIVINGKKDEHLEMLEGGLMRQLIDEKWKKFAKRRFIEKLILTFVHLSLISVAVYLRPANNLLAYSKAADGVRFASEIIVCLLCVGYLILEIVEIGAQGVLSFFKNCRNAPAHTVFLISCLFILLCIPCRFAGVQTVEDVLLIMAVPGSWTFLLFFARSVKPTGPFVTMIYRMCTGDLFRFGIIYLIFLTGFTQGFYFLFRDIGKTSFSTVPYTIMTLFQMTLGNFKYHDFDLTRYPLLTKLIFAVFMMLVPILLLNMLIAMMGNTYQSVIAKSKKQWRKEWANIIVILERGFKKAQLQRYHREYSITLTATENGRKTETRALVVIKTSAKTKARQRKTAISNWKKLGHEIVLQLKEQKRKGKNGPLKVKRLAKKQSKLFNESDDDDDDKKFSNIKAKLAWEKDIDLTKGQAFLTNPGIIENTASPNVQNVDFGSVVDKGTSDKGNADETAPIANGSAIRTIKKYVKKPNGTPRTSPKFQKQLSSNCVTPLSVYEDNVFDSIETNITQISPAKIHSSVDMFNSVLTPKQTADKPQANTFVVQTNNIYVNDISNDKSNSLKSIIEDQELARASSAESASYKQLVDEIIEGSQNLFPSKSEGTPSKHHKSNKQKKTIKEKSTERHHSNDHEDRHRKNSKELTRHLNNEQKETNKGNKTPASDEFLLSNLDVGESVL